MPAGRTTVPDLQRQDPPYRDTREIPAGHAHAIAVRSASALFAPVMVPGRIVHAMSQ